MNEITALERYYDLLGYIDHEVTRKLYRLLTSELNFVGCDRGTLTLTAGATSAEWLTRLTPLMTRALTYAGFKHIVVNPTVARRAELSLRTLEAQEVHAEIQGV